jgi:gluconate 2-dehydrogenase gamma chain
MTSKPESRRNFLKATGSVFGASLMAINMPLVLSACRGAHESMENDTGFNMLTSREAAVLRSVVDQIIPADETPGASETGVVHFIDAALGGFIADQKAFLREGLEDLDSRAKSMVSQADMFSDLNSEQQKQLLMSIEDGPFFGFLYFLTMCGMFCMPAYGGNRDYTGWDLLGFNHQHAWQPPFGYYDAAVHVDTAKGEITNEQA